MEAKDFDFIRFKDWYSEREEKITNFLLGKSDTNVILIEKEIANYVICRTPKESLECQLDAITRQMDFITDYVPFLEPWFGVGVFANAFGAEYVWIDGESAQTHYIVFNEEQADELQIPSIDDSPIMNLVLEAIDYFINETKGAIPISCTDTQSPLDTATLLWDTASFFTATYNAPEIVHKLLTNITSIMIEFSKRQIHHMGETRIRPGHNALSSKGGKGISISDDNIVMVSPSHYAEFSIPYNEILANEFGGLAIHSCGDIYRQLPNLLKTKGLNQLDVAFSLELDPNPNTKPELFRDLMKDSGIILHARIGSDWPEILPRLYHPDLKLALVVPQPEKHEPIDKNVKLLNKLLQTLIS